MLTIKLAPTGKKNQIHYRIVVAEGRSKLSGRAKAILGHYHPRTKHLTLDRAAVAQWLKKGASPTDRIRQLLKL